MSKRSEQGQFPARRFIPLLIQHSQFLEKGHSLLNYALFLLFAHPNIPSRYKLGSVLYRKGQNMINPYQRKQIPVSFEAGILLQKLMHGRKHRIQPAPQFPMHHIKHILQLALLAKQLPPIILHTAFVTLRFFFLSHFCANRSYRQRRGS